MGLAFYSKGKRWFVYEKGQKSETDLPAFGICSHDFRNLPGKDTGEFLFFVHRNQCNC